MNLLSTDGVFESVTEDEPSETEEPIIPTPPYFDPENNPDIEDEAILPEEPADPSQEEPSEPSTEDPKLDPTEPSTENPTEDPEEKPNNPTENDQAEEPDGASDDNQEEQNKSDTTENLDKPSGDNPSNTDRTTNVDEEDKETSKSANEIKRLLPKTGTSITFASTGIACMIVAVISFIKYKF